MPLQKMIKLHYFHCTILLLGTLLISQNSYAQLKCTNLQIDSLTIRIGSKEVNIKHIAHDTFKAYVPTQYGYSVFLFNNKTQQVASQISTYKATYYYGTELKSQFPTKPNETNMRPELGLVCRGIYNGMYNIVGVEQGRFKNDTLDGKINIQSKRKFDWTGSLTYTHGIKDGLEISSYRDKTYFRKHKNGRKIFEKLIYKDCILLRHQVFSPIKRLYEYEEDGSLIRIRVEDSIHLYYKKQKLAYSLTYNTTKEIWESQSFYPSGQVERYRPHTTYEYSPLAEATWYDENGNEMEEPEDLDTFMQLDDSYLESSLVSTYSESVEDDSILQMYANDVFIEHLDSLLLLSEKVKKKQTGLYQFELEVIRDGSPKVSFVSFDRKDHTIYQHVHYTLERIESEQLPLNLLSNYKVKYLKGTVDLQISKP